MFTLIEFLHVYDLDPVTGQGRNAEKPWWSLWLYPGRLADSGDQDDDDCGADAECWVKRNAIRLDGTWYDSRAIREASELAATKLRRAGHQAAIEGLVGD